MASRQGWLCTWPEMLALLDNLKKKLLRLCRFECGHNVSSENFYKGHKSPFGYEHTLCDHVAIKSYAERQSNAIFRQKQRVKSLSGLGLQADTRLQGKG